MAKKDVDLITDAGELDIKEYMYQMDQGFVAGSEAFDRQDFVSANVQFDNAWVQDCSANRLFYQALVLMSTAVLKIKLLKIDGCGRILEQVKTKMQRYRPVYLSINIDGVLAGIDQWLEFLNKCYEEDRYLEHQPSIPRLNVVPE